MREGGDISWNIHLLPFVRFFPSFQVSAIASMGLHTGILLSFQNTIIRHRASLESQRFISDSEHNRCKSETWLIGDKISFMIPFCCWPSYLLERWEFLSGRYTCWEKQIETNQKWIKSMHSKSEREPELSSEFGWLCVLASACLALLFHASPFCIAFSNYAACVRSVFRMCFVVLICAMYVLCSILST